LAAGNRLQYRAIDSTIAAGPSPSPSYYPAFLDLRGRRVVVVGGGAVATAKVEGLLPCAPARLVVVAPRASATIARLADTGALEWRARRYRRGDLAGADVAFGASDDRAVNAAVATEARARRVPVLAVDDAPNCDFIAPAVVRRGRLTLAISTNGRSPAMARHVREWLERELPERWDSLLEVATRARERLDPEQRRAIPTQAWQAALAAAAEALAREDHDLEAAVAALLDHLQPGSSSDPPPAPRPVQGGGEPRDASSPAGGGLVSLVGAGPGDPELLTVRAVERLRRADAVVYDRLIPDRVLALCRPDAELYDVGKVPGCHGQTQADINALLVRLGASGRRVVRLKGGDPYVFGRGGEEALALIEAGIPWEVVPGVSAALAAPAAAGIPVTHRGRAAAVTIATGHCAAGSDDHDWAALARTRGTLVFLMGVGRLERIAEQLLAHGRAPDEPAAVVEWATTPRQRTHTAALADIARVARAAGARAPAVLVVGPTVALGAQLADALAAAAKA
jgi:uroporphyrin-III C-methyltransferase / precorrin-2 dehydrogenase / sirohydrochlorin ferrochelatase